MKITNNVMLNLIQYCYRWGMSITIATYVTESTVVTIHKIPRMHSGSRYIPAESDFEQL